LAEPTGSRAWYEQPFREACLAVLPERLATLLRATGRGMVRMAMDEGMVKVAADPRGLLQGLRLDLEGVAAGLAEIVRRRKEGRGELDPDLAKAARDLQTEVHHLLTRMDALLAGPKPPGSG
jgi:hypothetical protein